MKHKLSLVLGRSRSKQEIGERRQQRYGTQSLRRQGQHEARSQGSELHRDQDMGRRAAVSRHGVTAKATARTMNLRHQPFVASQYRYRKLLTLRTRYDAVWQEFPDNLRDVNSKNDAPIHSVCLNLLALNYIYITF